jgi:hypothetical protein
MSDSLRSKCAKFSPVSIKWIFCLYDACHILFAKVRLFLQCIKRKTKCSHEENP